MSTEVESEVLSEGARPHLTSSDLAGWVERVGVIGTGVLMRS